MLLTALTLLGCGTDRPPDRDGDPVPAPGAAADRVPAPLPPLRGGARIVFFGDSLATAGARPYPERLPDHLGAEVEVINLSEPGTTTADWLPGSPLFERRLAPEIRTADLLVVTLGGNDLERALGGGDGFEALARAQDPELAARLTPALRRIRRNMAGTFDAIRAANPDAGILYVTYPDYSAASRWQEASGRLGTLGLRGGLAMLVRAARDAGPDLLVDLRSATGGDQADGLIAGEYLSEKGHALYGRELASQLQSP